MLRLLVGKILLIVRYDIEYIEVNNITVLHGDAFFMYRYGDVAGAVPTEVIIHNVTMNNIRADNDIYNVYIDGHGTCSMSY